MMYGRIKIAYWTACFLFLLVFYRWMMPNWWVNAAASAANLILFVAITENFVHRLAVPVYFRRGRHKAFLAGIFSCVLLNGVATLFATWFIIQPFSRSRVSDLFWQWENLIYGNFFVVVAFTSVSLAMKLTFDWLDFQRRMQELEREKTRAELEFLKAQLNPHFLFNSLNSIYGHIDRRNVEARRLLLRFADLLRYHLYECGADFIPVEKEVEYLEGYVEMQKQRRDEAARVELNLGGCLSGYEIAPLLLIPFVENAFKYVGNRDGAETYLRINLEGDGGALRFSCVNSKDDVGRAGRTWGTSKSGGMGLENVRRRLELIYPGRHRLVCRAEETQFSVELVIEL